MPCVDAVSHWWARLCPVVADYKAPRVPGLMLALCWVGCASWWLVCMLGVRDPMAFWWVGPVSDITVCQVHRVWKLVLALFWVGLGPKESQAW